MSSISRAARQRVPSVLCPFEHMSAGAIPSSPHGSDPIADSNREDFLLLEACQAFDTTRLAGALRGFGSEVLGAPRAKATEFPPLLRRASPRRTLLASLSPRLPSSPSPPHGVRRFCKREITASEASSAEHGESLPLRQHRGRRGDVRLLGARGTMTQCEATAAPKRRRLGRPGSHDA